MIKGRPAPEAVRLRVIQLLNSDAYKEREITLVTIAKRIGCSAAYVQNVRNTLKLA